MNTAHDAANSVNAASQANRADKSKLHSPTSTFTDDLLLNKRKQRSRYLLG